MAKKDSIVRLLKAGASYSEVAEAADCSTATISYHAENSVSQEVGRLGMIGARSKDIMTPDTDG